MRAREYNLFKIDWLAKRVDKTDIEEVFAIFHGISAGIGVQSIYILPLISILLTNIIEAIG